MERERKNLKKMRSSKQQKRKKSVRNTKEKEKA